MSNWLLIRTDIKRELYVAGQIAAMGFDAWVPMEYRTARVNPQFKRRAVSEHPVLPKRLFARVPVAYSGDLHGIRHLVAIECNSAAEALQIPEIHIRHFRDEIDKLNAGIMALNAIATRKNKAKWKNMRDALQELLSEAKQTALVQAA